MPQARLDVALEAPGNLVRGVVEDERRDQAKAAASLSATAAEHGWCPEDSWVLLVGAQAQRDLEQPGDRLCFRATANCRLLMISNGFVRRSLGRWRQIPRACLANFIYLRLVDGT